MMLYQLWLHILLEAMKPWPRPTPDKIIRADADDAPR